MGRIETLALLDQDARDTEQRLREMPEREQRPARRGLRAGRLAGLKVRNPAGESLGKIEEILLDLYSGQVAYAALSFGGFLGMSNKLFAVAWTALTLNEAEHEFILNVDRRVLEGSPGFDRHDWPDRADATWGRSRPGQLGKTISHGRTR